MMKHAYGCINTLSNDKDFLTACLSALAESDSVFKAFSRILQSNFYAWMNPVAALMQCIATEGHNKRAIFQSHLFCAIGFK